MAADRIDGHPGAGDTRIIDGLHQAGIKVVPTVMETMGPGVLAEILTDPHSRTTHVETLLTVVRARGYDGIDIDYESIAPTGEDGYLGVRAAYAAFARELCGRLHALGKQCVLTVSPQTADTGRIWDYAALGKAADRVRIMGYDLHWSGGAAGPLASPQWYDDILRHATALIPADRLEMGLPAYGWDWVPGGRTRHVTWKEAEALRLAKGIAYQLDPASQTPHFTYEEDDSVRDVWYQDSSASPRTCRSCAATGSATPLCGHWASRTRRCGRSSAASETGRASGGPQGVNGSDCLPETSSISVWAFCNSWDARPMSARAPAISSPTRSCSGSAGWRRA